MPKMSSKPLSHADYSVGWICALPLEMTAATAMFDEIHPRLPLPASDENTYVLGNICGHNVVMACLPSGVYGTTTAAIVASQMLTTYPNIRFGLMVGIGGGVPSKDNDIRLGMWWSANLPATRVVWCNMIMAKPSPVADSNKRGC